MINYYNYLRYCYNTKVKCVFQGCGFGYRYTRLPHLLKTKPEDANLPSLQSRCSLCCLCGGGLSCCHSVFVGVSPGCLCVDQFQLCSSPKRTEPNFLPHTVCLSFSVSFSLNIPVCHLSSFFGSVSAAGSGLSSRLLSRISINKLRLPVCLFLLRPCLIYSFNYQL